MTRAATAAAEASVGCTGRTSCCPTTRQQVCAFSRGWGGTAALPGRVATNNCSCLAACPWDAAEHSIATANAPQVPVNSNPPSAEESSLMQGGPSRDLSAAFGRPGPGGSSQGGNAPPGGFMGGRDLRGLDGRFDAERGNASGGRQEPTGRFDSRGDNPAMVGDASQLATPFAHAQLTCMWAGSLLAPRGRATAGGRGQLA